MELPPIPDDIISALGVFERREREFMSLIERTFLADDGNVYGMDWAVYAGTQRALSLMHSFDVLIRERQPRVAATFVRMQLDTAMRLNAFWMVADKDAIAQQLLSGEKFRKLKSIEGEPLTDKLLHERLEKEFPGVSRAYEEGCGFVHLSQPHMLSFFESVNEDGFSGMLSRFGVLLPNNDVRRLIDDFDDATVCLLGVCRKWIEEKERFGNGVTTLAKPPTPQSPKRASPVPPPSPA
jgi:hypothetical protein